MTPRFVIAGAFAPELDPIKKLLCSGQEMLFLELGVGAVSAAIKTANACQYLKKSKPPLFIFVGSIGSVDLEIPLLSFVSATETIWADLGNATRSSFFPDAQEKRFLAHKDSLVLLRTKLAEQCLFEPVYSTPSITRTREAALALRENTKARFENLELFGLASAAAQYGVPWVSFSAVTNYVSPGGHDQWRSNAAPAAQKTASELVRICTELSFG